MFTSQAPFMFSALGGAMSNDTVRQLTQVFANCNQALDHRGSVNLSASPFVQKNGAITDLGGQGLPPWASGNQAGNGDSYPFGGFNGSFYGGNYYGVDGPINTMQLLFQPSSVNMQNWVNVQPGDYTDGGPFVFPNIDNSYRAGDWYTYGGDQNYFDVAPRITETTNQYYGGPTFQVAGDTVFQTTNTTNSYTDNSVVNNLTVENVNGEPVKGDKGDPGQAGVNGAPGRPGDPGQAGPAGPAVFIPIGGGPAANRQLRAILEAFALAIDAIVAEILNQRGDINDVIRVLNDLRIIGRVARPAADGFTPLDVDDDCKVPAKLERPANPRLTPEAVRVGVLGAQAGVRVALAKL